MKQVRKKHERDAVGQVLLFDAERHCVLCGRRLRGDKSVKRQYGPRCWRKRVSLASVPSVAEAVPTNPR